MAFKLIYTSAPRLLQAGRSGFGTVAMSRNIPPQAVKTAEAASQFSRQPGFPADRVIYSYRTVRCPDGIWHVLSCVRDAGADYSGRTNHLAQHLILGEREASQHAASGITPAGIILGTPWPDHDGFCGWIDGSVPLSNANLDAHGTYWAGWAGSPHCSRNLSADGGRKPVIFVYDRGLEKQTDSEARAVLCLFAESQAECPGYGWGITFTTGMEPNYEASEFRWIGVAPDSPMLPKLEAAGGRVRVTLDTPPPAVAVPQTSEASYKPSVVPVSGGTALEQSRTTGDSFGSTPPRPSRPPHGASVPPRPVATVQNQKRRHVIPIFIPVIALAVLAFVLLIARGIIFSEPPKLMIGLESQHYTGKPIRVMVDGQLPPIPDISLSHETVTTAGNHDITVSHKGSLLGGDRTVKSKVTVEKANARISFEQDSLTWPLPNTTNRIRFSVDPAHDAGDSNQVLSDNVRIEHRGKNTSESNWTNNTPESPGLYRIKATLHSANYTGEQEADFEIKRPPPTPIVGPRVSHTVTPPQIVTNFIIAPESDALRFVKASGMLPDQGKLEICATNTNFAEITQMGTYATGGKDDLFQIEEGFWPNKKNAPVSSQPLIYRVTSQSSSTNLIIIEVRQDTNNSTAIKAFLPNAWISRSDSSHNLQLEPATFFRDATLLPIGAQWEVTITNGPYSCSQPLKLSSMDGVFSIENEQMNLAKMRDWAIANKQKALSDPPPQLQYFRENKSIILQPLRSITNGTPPASEVVAQADKIEPAKGNTNAAMLAEDLLIGVLNCAYSNQAISPRMQLTESVKSQLKGRNGAKHIGAPDDFRKELSQWTNVTFKAGATTEYLDTRMAHLSGSQQEQEIAKRVLDALKEGVRKYEKAPFQMPPPINIEGEQQKITAAQNRINFLNSVGTDKCSFKGTLSIRFPEGSPVEVMPIKLGPPK